MSQEIGETPSEDPPEETLSEGPHLPMETQLSVPGLTPGYEQWAIPLAEEKGALVRRPAKPSNLEEKVEEIAKAFDKKPWLLNEHLRDVLKGKRTATVVVGLGLLTIFSAGAGFEFGIRHGRDLHFFAELVKRAKKGKS